MARIVNGKFIPTDIVSKTLVGTAPDGRTTELMKIDQVDQFNPAGSIASFIRIQLNNHIDNVQDSFFFPLNEDMELKWAFLQTTESNTKLMEWEMALIQQQPNLNNFVTTISKEYFQKELGYSKFRIV